VDKLSENIETWWIAHFIVFLQHLRIGKVLASSKAPSAGIGIAHFSM